MRKLVVILLATALVAVSGPALADSDKGGNWADSQVINPDLRSTSMSTAGTSTDPEEALSSVEEAMETKTPDGAKAQLATGGEVTMKLLDLWLARGSLSGEDAKTADRLLARPDSGAARGEGRPGATKKTCTKHFCVHYKPAKSTKSYVSLVKKTMEKVYGTYKKSGYRMPASDRGRGGNNKIDIYLLDLASQGLYGYCQPEGFVKKKKGNAAFGFCALDNDYAASEYPTNTPKENLQVTAAHEFYHAVQFAYDVFEDRWLMEGMASWVEDEVYPKVNDNIQYLYTSQFTLPWGALDNPNAGGSSMMSAYGSWIFFRWLSENRPKKKGKLPKIGLQIWQQLDSMRGKKRNAYSIKGVSAALKKSKWSLDKAYATFTSAALAPAQKFKEGDKYVAFLDGALEDYTDGAPLVGNYGVTSTGSLTFENTKLPHLSSFTVRLNLQSGAGSKVKIKLKKISSWARVVVTSHKNNGAVKTSVFKPKKGKLSATTSSDLATFSAIDVTIVNVSTKYKGCKTRPKATAVSCGGKATQNKVQLKGALQITN